MRKSLLILLLALMLTGCRTIADIKPDTIVDIPLHPTAAQTEEIPEPVTEATELPTEPAAEVTEPAQPATQPPKTGAGSSSKPTGGGSKTTGSQKPVQGSTDEKPAATQPPTEPPSYDPSGYVPGSLDRAVADEINAQRLAEGLGGLRFDNRLCAIASVRARELAQTWYSSRPDGREGVTVLAEYGYPYSVAAENLYYGYDGAAAMVDKWMDSKYRRANILMEGADAIGVGSCTFDGMTFVAVLFVG